MRDIAVISFAQTPARRRVAGAQRGRDAHARRAHRAGPGRHDHRRHRLHLLGLHRLPGRRRLQLRVDARRRRPVAADPGEPRRDGRRLGPLRGLGEAPARRARHRPRLLLRQVVARRPADGADPPARPDHRRPAVARLGQPRRPPGPGPARRRQGHRGRHGRGRRPQPQGRRSTTPTPSWRGTGSADELLAERVPRRPAAQAATARRSPTAPPPSSWPPATSPARRSSARPGSGASTTASSPSTSASATSRSASRPASPPRRPASPTARSTWPSSTPRSPTRS